MLYISTDYVFDGVKPPYSEDSTPNPLNTYGETKLQGEVVTLETYKGMTYVKTNLLVTNDIDHSFRAHCIKDTQSVWVSRISG